MQFTQKKQYLLAGISVCLWGTLAAVNKILVNELAVNTVLFYTSFIAALSLLMFNLRSKGRALVRSYGVCDYVRMTLFGVLGFFCYNYFYCVGLTYLSSQEACIVNYMWPILTVIMCCIILKERFTMRKLLAAALSVIGMAVIVTQGDIKNIELGNMKGILACLFAAFCYSIFSALNKKEQYDQAIMLNVAYLVTAVISGMMSVVSGEFTVIGGNQIYGFLWSGVVVSALAYLLWGIAINSGNTAKIAILAYLCPFLSLVFGYFLLGERISLYSFGGLVLIIGGVLIQIGEKEALQA